MKIKEIYKYIIQTRELGITYLRKILDIGKKESKIGEDIDTQMNAEIIFITINNFLWIHQTLYQLRQ